MSKQHISNKKIWWLLLF